MAEKMTPLEFWQKYIEEKGLSADEEVFSGEILFEDRGITGAQQRNMILSGAKTAIFTSFDALKINLEPLPVAGEVYIAEDENENPFAIIEIDEVQVLPFNEITWETARLDGEDENFTQWQEKQRAFMQEEAEICGFEFTETSRIVFEHFHLIYR